MTIMNVRKLLLLLAFLVFVANLHGQNGSINGYLKTNTNSVELKSATLRVDNRFKYEVYPDSTGYFEVDSLKQESHTLEFHFSDRFHPIRIGDIELLPSTDLGTLIFFFDPYGYEDEWGTYSPFDTIPYFERHPMFHEKRDSLLSLYKVEFRALGQPYSIEFNSIEISQDSTDREYIYMLFCELNSK